MKKVGTVGMAGYEWVYTHFGKLSPDSVRGYESGYASRGRKRHTQGKAGVRASATKPEPRQSGTLLMKRI
jgi:hypothetical protein